MLSSTVLKGLLHFFLPVRRLDPFSQRKRTWNQPSQQTSHVISIPGAKLSPPLISQASCTISDSFRSPSSSKVSNWTLENRGGVLCFLAHSFSAPYSILLGWIWGGYHWQSETNHHGSVKSVCRESQGVALHWSFPCGFDDHVNGKMGRLV